MKKRLKKVELEIRDKDGNVIGFNLAASAANDDWLRAARLLKEGKTEEFRKLDSEPMFYRPDSLLKNFKKRKPRLKSR